MRLGDLSAFGGLGDLSASGGLGDLSAFGGLGDLSAFGGLWEDGMIRRSEDQNSDTVEYSRSSNSTGQEIRDKK